MFPHRLMTGAFWTSCFLMGYFYARLGEDEALRRVLYARYANFMTAFDYFAPMYEAAWSSVRDRVLSFEWAYESWYART